MSFRGVKSARGQATVELAFSILFLAIFFLLMLQVGLVARDQILVTQAAREGARAAAVDPSPESAVAAARSASGLEEGRLMVEVGARPDARGMVEVSTTYRSKVVFPGTGRSIIEPTLNAKASMRVEGSS
jgi:Flp pilus assembly protein TadG